MIGLSSHVFGEDACAIRKFSIIFRNYLLSGFSRRILGSTLIGTYPGKDEV
jgi:hypothetical protein